MGKLTSKTVNCSDRATLPKYVFVLSLENRSFDHLYGRSGLSGTDVLTGKTRAVNGVLKAGSTDPDDVDQAAYFNQFDGKPVPFSKANAKDVMPGDPKHEYEHILCQTCGPQACRDLYQAYAAAPEKQAYDDTKPDILPVPDQSVPHASGRFNRPPPATQDKSGFVHSWVKSYTLNKDEKDHTTPPEVDEVMRGFNTSQQLPVLYGLAKEFALCDNFFSSLPGPTGPNRFFMMAGSSAGFDNSPTSGQLAKWQSYTHLQLKGAQKHIFAQLDAAKVPNRIYGDDDFPMAAVLEGVSLGKCWDLHVDPSNSNWNNLVSLEYLLKGSFKNKPFPFNFVWIEPDYDTVSSVGHPTYRDGNSMHPCSDVQKGEKLIASVYNMIRANEDVWNNCAIFITWDEHGGFYDHVVSPGATPPGDGNFPGYNQWGFGFNWLGTRVPTLVISPLVKKNIIDGRLYHHGSILKTVHSLYNAGAFTDGNAPTTKMAQLTDRDGTATDFMSLFTLCDPRDTPAKAPTPKTPQPLPPPLPPDAVWDDSPPTGNLPAFLLAGLNLYKSAKPNADIRSIAAGLTTNKAALAFLTKAAKEIDEAQKVLANPPDLPMV